MNFGLLYTIMEYIEGTCLADLLQRPTESDEEEVVLADDVDDANLECLRATRRLHGLALLFGLFEDRCNISRPSFR